MIEITIRQDDKVIVRGLICDKYKASITKFTKAWIEDPENKKELAEEKPLGSSR